MKSFPDFDIIESPNPITSDERASGNIPDRFGRGSLTSPQFISSDQLIPLSFPCMIMLEQFGAVIPDIVEEMLKLYIMICSLTSIFLAFSSPRGDQTSGQYLPFRLALSQFDLQQILCYNIIKDTNEGRNTMFIFHTETVNEIYIYISETYDQLINTNENGVFVDFITGPIQSGKTYMSNEAIKETIKNGLFDDDHVIRCDLAKEKNGLESLPSNQYDDKPYLILLDNCKSKSQLVETRNAFDKIKRALIICIVKTYCWENFFPDNNLSPLGFISINDFAYFTITDIPCFITPKEYLKAKKLPVNRQALESNFDSYVKYSSFPEAATEKDPIKADNLSGLINSKIIDTICAREKCSKERLENILTVVLRNIGLPLSTNTIAKTLKYDYKTVKKHLDILRKYGMIYECRFRNIDLDKKTENKKNFKKYYSNYLSFLNSCLKDKDFPAHRYVLENLVLLLILNNQCLDDNASVFGGAVTRKLNYDFLVIDPTPFSNNKYAYLSILEKEKTTNGKSEFSKKINALKKIRNKGRKILLVEEEPPAPIKEGVEIVNIYDWLLNDEEETYNTMLIP